MSDCVRVGFAPFVLCCVCFGFIKCIVLGFLLGCVFVLYSCASVS